MSSYRCALIQYDWFPHEKRPGHKHIDQEVIICQPREASGNKPTFTLHFLPL